MTRTQEKLEERKRYRQAWPSHRNKRHKWKKTGRPLKCRDCSTRHHSKERCPELPRITKIK